jgi:hypothetical protein
MTILILVSVLLVAAGAWFLLRGISQRQADLVLGVDAMARYIAAIEASRPTVPPATRERPTREAPLVETIVPETVGEATTILLNRRREFVRAVPSLLEHAHHAIVVDEKGYRLVMVDPEGRRYFVPTRA